MLDPMNQSKTSNMQLQKHRLGLKSEEMIEDKMEG